MTLRKHGNTTLMSFHVNVWNEDLVWETLFDTCNRNSHVRFLLSSCEIQISRGNPTISYVKPDSPREIWTILIWNYHSHVRFLLSSCEIQFSRGNHTISYVKPDSPSEIWTIPVWNYHSHVRIRKYLIWNNPFHIWIA